MTVVTFDHVTKRFRNAIGADRWGNHVHPQ
jgi:hypothetical protein